MKVRFRVAVLLVVEFWGVGVETGLMVRLGVFSMSGLGAAWAELALEDDSMVFSSALSAAVGLWWRTPPAMENGWFSQTRHVKVGK